MAKKSKTAQTRALEIIYTFFIGILVTVFVGVGIDTFYKAPEPPETPTALKLYRQPVEVGTETTMSAELEREQIAYDRDFEAYQKEEQNYNKNVSIIALIAAIIVLVISLMLFKQLLIISDGLLLGGVFTLLYSVVRVFASGDDTVRFVVVTVGLIVALGLGYKKFIKGQ